MGLVEGFLIDDAKVESGVGSVVGYLGCSDGKEDGIGVGLIDGVNVGVRVGLLVGSPVGLIVGVNVGDWEGFRDGL